MANPEGQSHSQALLQDSSPYGFIPSPSTQQANHMYMLLALGSALLFPCLRPCSITPPSCTSRMPFSCQLSNFYPSCQMHSCPHQSIQAKLKYCFYGTARFSGYSEPHIACFILCCGLWLCFVYLILQCAVLTYTTLFQGRYIFCLFYMCCPAQNSQPQLPEQMN